MSRIIRTELVERKGPLRFYRKNERGNRRWDGDTVHMRQAEVLLEDGNVLKGMFRRLSSIAYLNHNDGETFTLIDDLNAIVSIHYTEQP